MRYTTADEFQAHVTIYFKLHPQEQKFESETNVKAIITRMNSYGLSFPSDTMVLRAIRELVSEGVIDRADGGDSSTDKLAAAIAERNRIAEIAARPLTERDFDSYIRMMPSVLEQRYYSDSEFAARYDVACKVWGFKKPLRDSVKYEFTVPRNMLECPIVKPGHIISGVQLFPHEIQDVVNESLGDRLEFNSTPEPEIGWTPGVATGLNFKKR